MTDDDPWNLVLYNDSEVGPSVTPFANNLDQGGTGAGSPPANPDSGVNLSALLQTGLGSSVIAGLLPQRPGGSAALLPPSALTPPQPLYDPAPFAPPEMTMDQVALALGISPEQLAKIHNDAVRQAGVDIVGAGLKEGVLDTGLAAVGMPGVAIRLIGLGMDANDAFDISQQLHDAPDQAIFKSLNDSEIQSIPSTAKPWLP